MRQTVLPIKDTNILHEVENSLLTKYRYGERNLMIFKVGMVTMLRVSDVLRLKIDDVFNNGEVKKDAFIHDKKTGKPNVIYLKPLKKDLEKYYEWLKENDLLDKWLFPSSKRPERHITEKQYYKIMADTGDWLGIPYLGTHTMRKTGAYRVYQQSNHDIGLVMHLLNHSSEKMTLAYLGLDRESVEDKLDKIDFD